MVLFEEPSQLVKVVSPLTTSQEILMGDGRSKLDPNGHFFPLKFWKVEYVCLNPQIMQRRNDH